VEAPDEAGHSGDLKIKIKAIEDFDTMLVGTLLRGIKTFEDYRILLMPDHPTPLEVRTHTTEPVPFVIYDSRIENENPIDGFSEAIEEVDDILSFEEGYRLMDYFLQESPNKE
jgi:2,3-bisphosphoglycerate-independent phosphoglycerate mutase